MAMGQVRSYIRHLLPIRDGYGDGDGDNVINDTMQVLGPIYGTWLKASFNFTILCDTIAILLFVALVMVILSVKSKEISPRNIAYS